MTFSVAAEPLVFPSLPVHTMRYRRFLASIPALTATLAFALAQASPAATLKHHYPFNTNASDDLGVTNLTPVGDSVTYVSSGGAAGGFLRLGGSDDYLVATAGSNLSVLGDYSTTFRPFSLSVWVRQTAAQASANTIGVIGMTTESTNTASATPNFNTGFEIATRESAAGLGVRIRCRAGGTGDGAGFIATGLNIANGNWHHVVADFEAGGRSVYVDGVLVGTSTTAVAFVAGQPITRFAVGAFLRSNQIVDDLNGDIDDLQIYDGALTATEALQLYQNPGLTLDNNLPPASGTDLLPAGTALADVVDTMIGVAGGANTGSTVPGACLPFSSIYPSPDTVTAAAGGYSAGSDTVGFAQLHATGAGSSTMSFGNFLVSPRLGANTATTEAGNASPIANVVARPYSYRGRLTTPGIDCTVVPTANCAIYQFDFPASTDARIYFDVARKLNSATGMTDGSVTVDLANGTVSGGGTFDGNWNPAAYNVYFYAKLDTTPASGGTWLNSTPSDGVLSVTTATRQRIGSWVKFNTSTTRTVRMKIGVSFQSVAKAQQYVESEIPAWDLAGLETTAKTSWNNALGVLQTPGITTAEARKLYTALFHSLIQPRNRTGDPAGWPADASFWDDQYTPWDTWQTLYPLLDIVSPSSVASIVNSFGERYARNGKAETAFIQGKDFQVGQGGDEVDRIIADAYVKGIPGIDWTKIWPLLQFNAGRRTDDYRNLGFVSMDGSHNGYDSRMASGSSTIAFAHGDWCAALVGAGLGHTAEAQALLTRSTNWRNVWDTSLAGDGFSGFVHGKNRNGTFTSVAATSSADFYQGTCWNYSFNVFDRDAMIDLMGGRARFIQRLEFAFGKNSTSYLDFGNEVNLQAVPLLSRAQRPGLSAYWADNVRNRFGVYNCPGDEDSGAMSSLYFFLTAGFVPAATEDAYYLHGPRVPRLEFNVGGGKTFTITAANSGGSNLYVQSATLDGLPLNTAVIHHADIMAGKTLAFVMGPNPSSWGTGEDFSAPSRRDAQNPVNAGWTAALGSPQITDAATDSPSWGTGANGADNTAIYSAFPDVTLTQAGSSITLSATVTISGMTTTQATPNARLAWGLFNVNGQAGVTGWPGYLAGNDTVDATGKVTMWRKDSGNATAYHSSSSGATALTSYSQPAPAFADDTYRLTMTLARTTTGALDYNAALVRSSDGVLFAAFTGSDLTPPTYTFNRVGLRAGDVLDADSVQVSQAMVIANGIPTSPAVSMTSPVEGATFAKNASITLSADASATAGRTVSKVEFFASGTKIAEAVSQPYSFAWSGMNAGSYALTATATDSNGETGTSAAVNIVVTNTPPSVTLTSPSTGTSYQMTDAIPLAATASDTDGTVTKVEFYAGTTKLGQSTSAPFTFAWTGAAAGVYSLTAVATDEAGAATTSAPISVFVSTASANFTFAENFDSMGTTGTTPPTGWSIKQGGSGTTNATWTTTVTGSGVAAMVAAATPLTAATAPSTSSGSNNGYNAQGTSSSDRVLATSPTSVAGSALQLSLTNNAGAAFSSITIGYDTRRYTAVATANELPGYWLFYSLDNGTTWTNVSALNPTISTVPNTVGVTNTPATAVALSTPWAAGATLLLRWVDDNAVATSPDQTLGLDNVTVSASAVGNVPPAVSLTSPTPAATFDAPATINLAATASDTDGTISKVEFYNGAALLGTATTSPYTYAWTGVFTGSYSLTAKATDNMGAITTSSAVSVTVTNTDNTSPSVSITSPTAGAPFTVPASVGITASASDTDGTISKVEFYNGATLLGQATTAPYTFNWTSVAAGTYSLTAKATDNDGGTTTSAAVSITVSSGSSIISLSESFDSMGSSGTALPSGWSYYSLSGSHEDFIYAPPAASTFLPNSTNTAILVGPGADTIAANATLTAVTGPTTQKGSGAYNFSLSATPGDRSVGTSPSGNSAGEIQWSLTNTTGGSINSFSIGYDIRRFSITTNNNATYDTSPYKGLEEIPGYWLFYSLDNGVTWTNVSELNPTIAGPTGVIVPNSVGVTTVPSTTVSLSGSWASGGTLLLRWFDDNAESPSPDQIIGLDNVTFAAGTVVGSAPTVALTSPTAGATFTTPATVSITATAADSDGTITKVEFYNGATLLGSATAAPYTFNWTGVVAGSYSLTARATDNDGNVTASTAVAITVTPSGTPPSVAITAPTASTSFTAPATINITATATDSDGTIAKVEFYNDTTLLGSATTAPYSYAWTNVAAGSYNLTAKATDNSGNVTTSSTVAVTVDAAGAGSGTLTRGPYLQKASPTAITIRWRSSLSVTGRVRYGTSAANLTGTVNESSSTTEHEVRITGLTAAATYFYSIGSANDTLLGDTTTTFTTPPVPGPAVPTRVWVLGDAGTSSANQTAVRDAFYNWTGSRTPDMVLQLGDNAYNSGLDTEFQTAVFNMYTSMLRKTPFWSCLGNHETNQATSFVDTYPYFNIYSFPTAGECGGVASGTEHYYSWDYGNIHFISLDSMTAGRTSTGAQATWLTNDLASTTATWIIVIFHHPPYTKGSHNSDSETELIEMRQNILPILEKGGVDLVLSGHSHCYERSYLLDGHYGLSGTLTASMKKNAGNGRIGGGGAYVKPLTGPRDHFGTVYCVTGSAGQTGGGSLNHPANFISLNNLGSTVLDINDTRLDLTFLRENSTTPDTFTMIKQGAADSDGDGVPDSFELAHGMNRFDSSDATKKDANGLDARSAYLLGVEPGSGNTYHWSTSAPDAATGAVTATFPTLADHKYQVFWSTDLSTWTAASAVVVGDGNAHTWTDDGTVTGSLPGGQDGQRFYRVQVGSYP